MSWLGSKPESITATTLPWPLYPLSHKLCTPIILLLSITVFFKAVSSSLFLVVVSGTS